MRPALLQAKRKVYPVLEIIFLFRKAPN